MEKQTAVILTVLVKVFFDENGSTAIGHFSKVGIGVPFLRRKVTPAIRLARSVEEVWTAVEIVSLAAPSRATPSFWLLNMRLVLAGSHSNESRYPVAGEGERLGGPNSAALEGWGVR